MFIVLYSAVYNSYLLTSFKLRHWCIYILGVRLFKHLYIPDLIRNVTFVVNDN